MLLAMGLVFHMNKLINFVLPLYGYDFYQLHLPFFYFFFCKSVWMVGSAHAVSFIIERLNLASYWIL